MAFVKATKKQKKLRLALIGPSGSGKTYSALAIATALGDNVAVFDTENGSASLYSDIFPFVTPDRPPPDFAPAQYIAFLNECERDGIDVAVLDGMSAAWSGKGGVLEIVDNASRRLKGNSFAAWKDAAPEQNRLVEAIINCKVHVIVTMRTKTEWVVEEDDRGKKVPKKLGLAPVQRQDLDYEFDVVGELDHQNAMVVSKTRCSALAGKSILRPGKELANLLKAWLGDGAPPAETANPLEKQLQASVELNERRAKAVSELRDLFMAADSEASLSAAKELMKTANTEKLLSRASFEELVRIGAAKKAELEESATRRRAATEMREMDQRVDDAIA